MANPRKKIYIHTTRTSKPKNNITSQYCVCVCKNLMSFHCWHLYLSIYVCMYVCLVGKKIYFRTIRICWFLLLLDRFCPNRISHFLFISFCCCCCFFHFVSSVIVVVVVGRFGLVLYDLFSSRFLLLLYLPNMYVYFG